jgi:hypothetical protein
LYAVKAPIWLIFDVQNKPIGAILFCISEFSVLDPFHQISAKSGSLHLLVIEVDFSQSSTPFFETSTEYFGSLFSFSCCVFSSSGFRIFSRVNRKFFRKKIAFDRAETSTKDSTIDKGNNYYRLIFNVWLIW